MLHRLTGFMFYAHHPLIIVFSFHLFWTLFLYNEYIPLGESLSFYPHILFAVAYLWWLPIARMRLGYFGLLTARMYAYSHAVKTAFLRRSVGWVSTNAKHSVVSAAFNQTTAVVTLYVSAYCALVLLGLHTGDIHLSDHRYWSIQFWLFWNLLLVTILLYQMLVTKNRMTGAYAQFDYAPVKHIGVVVAVVTVLLANSVVRTFRSLEVEVAKLQMQPVEMVEVPISPVVLAAAPEESATPSATPRRIYRPKPSPIREPGGWYWQKDLGRAQRWIGVDAEGRDMWSD